MVVDADPGPFVGPRPFDRDDAIHFFGRTRESWDLSYSGALSRRLVVLCGPAGVGKTSLIQAGVLATIRPDMADVLPVASLTPATGEHPAGTNAYARQVVSAWAPDAPCDTPDLTLSQFLQRIVGDAARPLVVVIDQFESVFANRAEPDSDRERFLELLAEAMEDIPHLHLVLAIRSDLLHRLEPYEAKLSGGDGWRYQLAPLSPGAALEAVVQPLRATRRSFATGVAESLVDQLRTKTLTDAAGERRTVVSPTLEPTILQVVCASLWQTLPQEIVTISAQDVRRYGDVETALTGFCLRAVIDASVATGLPLQTLWEWLETTFVTDLGTRGSAHEGREATARMPNVVARTFEEHGILRAEMRAEALWYELLDDGLVEPVRRGRRLSRALIELAGPGASTDACLMMAESALQSGRLADAEQYARGAVQANRHDVRSLAEAKAFLGEILLDQGRRETGTRAEEFYATAEESFRSAAELYETSQNAPAVARALAALGRLHMERGRSSEALQQLRSALDRVRGDANIRVDFARVLNDAGQAQAALSEYTHALRDDPGAVEALVGRGTLSAKRGDATSALRDLDTAIRLRPDVADREEVISARSRASAHLDRRR